MRAIWSGALSFGLVNIPIKMYTASKDEGLDFDLLHKKDYSPIRYAKVCKTEEKEVPYNELVKGYEYEKGDYVILQQDDFIKANVKKTKTIDVLEFVNEGEIDSVYYEKPYYLEPDKSAQKAYSLMIEALRKSKKVGIAKFVIRTRQRLGIIKPLDNVIVLNQMRFQSEIKDAKEIKAPNLEVSDKEIEMALALINQLSGDFKPEEFHDTYTEDLKKLIDEKAKGEKITAKEENIQETSNVTDLMALLKKSLEQEKEKEEPKRIYNQT